MKTIAEKIAGFFKHDGTRWETENGRLFDNICIEHEADIQESGEKIRYLFPDGSAIIESGGVWYIDGSEPS